MRAKHSLHTLSAFPVYSSAFISDNQLVLGGGGGASRSGIKNKLRLYSVPSHDKLDSVTELQLEPGEDAPMSMAADWDNARIVCGINSPGESLARGENQNCRVYSVDSDKIALQGACQTIRSADAETYQRITAFSSNYHLLAVGSTNNEVTLLNYPSLEPVGKPISITDGELFDATFSESLLVITTTTHLLIYSLPANSVSPTPASTKSKSKKRKQSKGKVKEANGSMSVEFVKKVERPKFEGPSDSATTVCSFRAARISPTDENTLVAVVNSVPKSKKSKKASYICKWTVNDDSEEWSVKPHRMRRVGERNITCFDLSNDGKLMAYGASDYSIGIVDAQSLAPLLTILQAHAFAITTIRFNPATTLLVSGSPDNSVRVVSVPDRFVEGAPNIGAIIMVVIAILIIILAISAQLFFGGGFHF